jgi:hypothetical protein
VENGGTVGEDTPGKGGRYSFEAKDYRGLKKSFEAWSAAKSEVSTDENEESETETTDEVEEVEELDELEV